MEVEMRAGTRFGIALAAVFATVAIAAIPAGASTKTAPAKLSACPLTNHEIKHLGASYVYTLKVANLSCDKAKGLVKEFHACRHDHGGADGTCNSFSGYSCKEKVTDEAPTQFSAKATCRKGSKKFKQTFGENT
jgi:hypothetical protein